MLSILGVALYLWMWDHGFNPRNRESASYGRSVHAHPIVTAHAHPNANPNSLDLTLIPDSTSLLTVLFDGRFGTQTKKLVPNVRDLLPGKTRREVMALKAATPTKSPSPKKKFKKGGGKLSASKHRRKGTGKDSKED